VTDHPENNQLQRTIDLVSIGLFVALFLSAIFGDYGMIGRIILLVGGIGCALIYFLYSRFVTSGPYDMHTLAPVKLLPISVLLVIVALLTGGAGSPFLLTFFYPVLMASLEQGRRYAVRMSLGMIGSLFVLSLTSTGSIGELLADWPLLLLTAALLMALSYWMGFLSDELSAARQEKESLLNVDSEKSEFIGLASHHLRTPLTGMKGYLSFLSDESMGSLTDQQRQIVQRLEASMKKLESIVENLLMAASMANGKVKIHTKLGDISRLVRNTLAQHTAAIESKNLKLVAEVPDFSGQPILIDENRLHEVFDNIFSNAIKFTEKGFIKVQLQEVEGWIRINIVDSGIGISRKELPHLFQKFGRTTSIMGSFDQEGVGLGLYISQLIVEAHGGKITVESVADQGSIFSIFLPKP